MNNEKEEKNSK